MQTDRSNHQSIFQKNSSPLSIAPVVALFNLLLEWKIKGDKSKASKQPKPSNNGESK